MCTCWYGGMTKPYTIVKYYLLYVHCISNIQVTLARPSIPCKIKLQYIYNLAKRLNREIKHHIYAKRWSEIRVLPKK